MVILPKPFDLNKAWDVALERTKSLTDIKFVSASADETHVYYKFKEA